MDLFNLPTDQHKNWLPYQGKVRYYGPLFTSKEADAYFKDLMQTTAWKQDEAILFGKKILTKRKVAWYGDQPFAYTYSNSTKYALPWTPVLMKLKEKIESQTGETFNSCLLNLYHDGSEGMAWHSDGEKDLKKRGTIASLSFGAMRKFSFKHKRDKLRIDLMLEHGSLLLMQDETQVHWLHRLPPSKKIHHPRINLTFRTIETA